MQRLGRKGHPTYRVVVQDSRQTPTSGKYVALLGSYDPHAKTSTLVKEKAEFYLKNGAQPSERVVNLLQAEGVKLPSWVKTETTKKSSGLKNPDKLRKNRPAEPEAPAAEATVEAETPEAPAEVSTEPEASVEPETLTETPTEEKVEVTPAESATEAKPASTETPKDK